MLLTKIIEVPVAQGARYAEEVVNAELAKIDGTISSQIALDERRVMVFYEGEASSTSTSTHEDKKDINA